MRRKFTSDFKIRVVEEREAGVSVEELAKKHKLSKPLIYRGQRSTS